MIRKIIAMLLVLAIGLLPIASAFAACGGAKHIEMNGMMPDSTGIDSNADGAITHKSRTNIQGSSLSEMECHSGGDCVFHLCGSFGLTASNQFTSLFHTNIQFTLSDANLEDRLLSPELRPPIITL